jgi:hypothetical protein
LRVCEKYFFKACITFYLQWPQLSRELLKL